MGHPLVTEKWLLILKLEVSISGVNSQEEEEKDEDVRQGCSSEKKRVSLLKEKTVSSKLGDPRSDLLEEKKDEEGRLSRSKK